jgi:hypothetical protein
VLHVVGWAVEADVARKAALIAHNVSDRFVIEFDPTAVRLARFRTVAVQYLSSYEHMGVLRVELFAVNATVAAGRAGRVRVPACPAFNTTAVGRHLVGSRVLDGLWNERISVPVTAELTYAGLADSRCLHVQVAVVEATPPRGDNKAKVITLTLS